MISIYCLMFIQLWYPAVMEVLISIHVALMFDTVNSTCTDLDKKILLHIHDITYLAYSPRDNLSKILIST